MLYNRFVEFKIYISLKRQTLPYYQTPRFVEFKIYISLKPSTLNTVGLPVL